MRLKYSPQVDGKDIRFRLYAPKAEQAELCIFDTDFKLKSVIEMKRDGEDWLASYPMGSVVYAYRIVGPWQPRAGSWFNPNKFLFDPFASVVGRAPVWSDKLFSHCGSELELNLDSNQDCAALSAFVPDNFDWQGDLAPNRAWSDTVIYEAHIKGLTNAHPEVENNLQGTYLGLAAEPVVEHLKKIGVTAIELLPVQAFFTEYSLHKNNLKNYWGYNPYAWMAPDPRYSSQKKLGSEVFELKQAIKTLHAAGIEVILDLVFNHSAEGEFLGPVLSMRGIANSYYLFDRDYINYTGCGNTLDFSNPLVRALTHDSLESWVRDYHIDGFRFDLAATLVRRRDKIDQYDSFFTELLENPLMQGKKIIAEPWDIGGYELGTFPKRIAEWNDTYRDTVRKYWAGWDGVVSDFATKLAGSSDKFENKGPLSSVNFITAHDGFCLQDLVSYSVKRNQANGENNRDGADNNFSFNCGIEGQTTDLKVVELRQKLVRNYFFTLIFSAGVPMICAGDEIGKTQWGNNNAYCHDSALTWISWDIKYNFCEYFSALVSIRKELGVFNREEFYNDQTLTWLAEDGQQMSVEQWQSYNRKVIGAVYRAESSNVLVLYNSSENEIDFKLQRDAFLRVDTSKEPYIFKSEIFKSSYRLAPKSAALLVER